MISELNGVQEQYRDIGISHNWAEPTLKSCMNFCTQGVCEFHDFIKT